MECVWSVYSGGSGGGCNPPFQTHNISLVTIKNYCKVKMAEIHNTTAALQAKKWQGSITTLCSVVRMI